jgi:lipoprotein signal peptidase
VFNVADSAIVMGAVLIVIGTVRRGSRERGS